MENFKPVFLVAVKIFTKFLNEIQITTEMSLIL